VLDRRRTVFRLIAVGLASAALTASAAVADASASIALSARPGATVSFTVPAAGASACTVRAGNRRATTTARGATGVRVGFRVARRAAPGPWRITVVCAPRAARSAVLTVRRARRTGGSRAGLVAGPLRVVATGRARSAAARPPAAAPAPTAPAVAGPLSETDALARARADWATYGPAYVAVFRNGQCTDWAEQKRPDIVEQATVRLWADHLMSRPDPGISWDGGYWDDMARAARLPVGTVPRAGAVVTFDPGVMGAGVPTGHIAYVESVGNGTFTISEMNAPLPWKVTYRTLSTDVVAQGGITFVY